MKIITPIITTNKQINNTRFHEINFRGNNDWHVFGFDEGGQGTRDYIRNNIEQEVINRNNGIMSAEQLKKLITKLVSYPSVDNEKMNSIGLVNLKSIGNKSYAGSMIIVSDPKQLPKLKMLKDAGIRQIVDLDKVKGLEEECKKLGLKYFNFKHINSDNIVFEPNGRRDRWGYHRKSNKFFEECRPVLNSIIELIQIMQKGNVYIGCRNGTDYSDCALCLDYLFNPESNHAAYASPIYNHYCNDHYFSSRHWTQDTPRISYLREKFTHIDLQRMHWTSNTYWDIYLPRLIKACKS